MDALKTNDKAEAKIAKNKVQICILILVPYILFDTVYNSKLLVFSKSTRS
jgi:hypothetical protein